MRRGLTLMELIVALAVIGTALAAGYGALAQMAELRGHAERATREAERAATVRRTLRAWLAGARLTVEEDAVEFRGLSRRVDDEGRPGGRETVADDALSFVTVAPTPLGLSQTVVVLAVDHDPRTPETGLVAELADVAGTRRERLVLLPGARALSLRYLAGFSLRREWLPSWISATVLPVAVELAIPAAPGDSVPALLRPPLLVPLVVDP